MDFEEDPDYESLENMLTAIKDKLELGDTFEWEKQKLSKKNMDIILIQEFQLS
jgi:hypothetical protein